MLNRLKKSCTRRPVPAHYGLLLLAASMMLALFLQPACSKKSKVPPAAIAPIKVVLLPFNVPAGNNDLRWAALAAPILMAKASEQSPDLVVIPLWEAMPTIIESAGASRTLTPESAASVASWLAVKWATLGEISPAKNGVSVTLDFIPAKSSQVPFRYLKTGRMDSLGSGFQEAIIQFLHYLVARPLQPAKGLPSMTSMKDLAEALDREYGWFVNADPGKAQEIVSNLASSDERLARFLFNPSLYPVLAQTK